MNEAAELEKAKMNLAEAIRHLNNVRNMTSSVAQAKKMSAIKELIQQAAAKF